MTGVLPFSRHGCLGVIPKVISGARPERPAIGSSRGLTDTIWAMVENCWSQQIFERPTISIVLQALNHASRYWEPALDDEKVPQVRDVNTTAGKLFRCWTVGDLNQF
jgi:hypothetical protein